MPGPCHTFATRVPFPSFMLLLLCLLTLLVCILKIMENILILNSHYSFSSLLISATWYLFSSCVTVNQLGTLFLFLNNLL